MDLVTVAVPIYNVEKYLEKCINSIIGQTYKNLEILLINDGSPDKSDEIMKKYEKKDKRIRCFYKKNGGLSDTRNYAIKRAKGKYICFVDSDDWLTPKYVEKMVKLIKKEKSDMVACEFDRVYDKKVSVNKLTSDDVAGFKIPAAWNKLFILEKIKENKIVFPKGLWYEDLATTSLYVMSCKKVSIIHESLYMYRQNNSSIMHTYDDRIFHIYDAINRIEKYAKENDLFDSHFENIEFANIYHVILGTTFRGSFHKDFSVSMIKNIAKYVEEKFPKWYNNKVVKRNLGISYKMILSLFKMKQYWLIYILFKFLNKFLYL